MKRFITVVLSIAMVITSIVVPMDKVSAMDPKFNNMERNVNKLHNKIQKGKTGTHLFPLKSA